MKAIEKIISHLQEDARQSAELMQQMIARGTFGAMDYAYQQGRYHEAMTTLRRI